MHVCKKKTQTVHISITNVFFSHCGSIHTNIHTTHILHLNRKKRVPKRKEAKSKTEIGNVRMLKQEMRNNYKLNGMALLVFSFFFKEKKGNFPTLPCLPLFPLKTRGTRREEKKSVPRNDVVWYNHDARMERKRQEEKKKTKKQKIRR